MARPAMTPSFETREQWLSLVSHLPVGSSTWAVVNQGRVVSPEAAGDEQTYARIGDRNQKRVSGPIATNVTVRIYVEDDIDEVAAMLGFEMGAAWVGTEQIELTGEVIGQLKIGNYDGTTLASTLLFTEHIYNFRPSSLTMELDAQGDVRIAEIRGGADRYYIIPEAP